MDPPAGLRSNLASVLTTLPPDVLNTTRVVKPQEGAAALPSFAGSGGAKPATPPTGGGAGGAPNKEVVGSAAIRIFGPLWRQLILRICLFHAMLLERRHYHALGWRLPYDFSAADFSAAVKQVLQVRRRTALLSRCCFLALRRAREIRKGEAAGDACKRMVQTPRLSWCAAWFGPQVHREMGGGVGPAEADLDVINRSLPGLLYVAGQCLYGGKVRPPSSACILLTVPTASRSLDCSDGGSTPA